MTLRTTWLRSQRHWICFGLGTVCATGLAVSGCSRAPLTRFQEMTSAPREAVAEPVSPASRPSEQPRPGDAVAQGDSSASGWRDRLSLTGRETRKEKERRYQEEFAEFGRRVMDSRESQRGDPFLDAEAAGRGFPPTDSLAPRPGTRSNAPSGEDGVARSGRAGAGSASIDTASLERRAPAEGLARTQPAPSGRPAEAGVARTSPPATTAPSGTRELSRLEQLRAELREERPALTEGIARSTPVAPPAAEGDRGPVLSQGQLNEGQVAPASTTAPTGIARTTGLSTPPPSAGEDLELRVQSLLAAADWQVSRGELEEAYRNVILAQQLAERGAVTFGPRDRHPTDVAQKVWEALSRERGATEIARSLPPPKLPDGARRRPVPPDAFAAAGERSWRMSGGQSEFGPDRDPLPVVEPRAPAGGATTAAAPGQHTAPEGARPLAAPLAAPSAQHNPVTVATITPEPAETSAEGGVVTALAEAPAAASPGAPPTVPAMATLPKADRPLPAPGPALEGPILAKVEPIQIPPHLSVASAKRLQPGAAEAPASRRPPWGLVGIVAGLLAAAYLFRRRWSAASVKASGSSLNPPTPE